MVNATRGATGQNRRLVRLRWVAVAGISIATVVSSWLGLVETVLPLYAIAAFMLAYNLALQVTVHGVEARPRSARRVLIGQLGLDLVALTALLHFSGGIENPFAFYYIFLVIIASLTFTKREAYAFAALAFALYTAMALLEYAGRLPHYHLRLLPHPPGLWASRPYLLGTLLVMGSTLAVVTVFSSATMERLRASLEAELALRKKTDHQERLAIIGEVVAGVVHELSSPLNGVRNSFRALLRDPEGFLKRGDILRLMNEALERMAAISRRLLTLARDPQLDKQPLVVNEVVERSLAELQHRVDSTGVLLESRLAPWLPPILADSIAVGEVITNLVSNALDAVEGGGRVTVETSHDHGDIEIRVMDTGRGIPPSTRARLFEPFQSTKPVGKGTGLGLAISKRLVEAHGGSIAVDSREGEGTVATVRLPPAGEGAAP